MDYDLHAAAPNMEKCEIPQTEFVLPRVMSQLIRMSLEDIEACEKAENIRIDMDTWHGVVFEDIDNRAVPVCVVCLAGSTMRQRLGVKDDQDAVPTDFPQNKYQLDAINCLRRGWASSAMDTLGLLPNAKEKGYEAWSAAYNEIEAKFDRDITPHEADPEQFKADMRMFAGDLEEAGL